MTFTPSGSQTTRDAMVSPAFQPISANNFYVYYLNQGESTGSLTFTPVYLTAGATFRIRINFAAQFVYLNPGQSVTFQVLAQTNLIEFDVIQAPCSGDIIEEYSITVYQPPTPGVPSSTGSVVVVPSTGTPSVVSSSSTGAAMIESSTAPSFVESSTAPSVVVSSTASAPVESSTAPMNVESSTAPAVVVSSTAPASVESSTAPAAVVSSSSASNVESSTAPAEVSSTASTVESSTASVETSSTAPAAQASSTAPSTTVESSTAPATTEQSSTAPAATVVSSSSAGGNAQESSTAPASEVSSTGPATEASTAPAATPSSTAAPQESSTAQATPSTGSSPVASSTAQATPSTATTPVVSSTAAPVESSTGSSPVASSTAAPVASSTAAPVASSTAAPAVSSSASPIASSTGPATGGQNVPTMSSATPIVETSSTGNGESQVSSSTAASTPASSTAVGSTGSQGVATSSGSNAVGSSGTSQVCPGNPATTIVPCATTTAPDYTFPSKPEQSLPNYVCSCNCPYPKGYAVRLDSLKLSFTPAGTNYNMPLSLTNVFQPLSSNNFYVAYRGGAFPTGTVHFTPDSFSVGATFRIRVNFLPAEYIYITAGQNVDLPIVEGTNLIEFDVIQAPCAGDDIEEYSITVYQQTPTPVTPSTPAASTGGSSSVVVASTASSTPTQQASTGSAQPTKPTASTAAPAPASTPSASTAAATPTQAASTGSPAPSQVASTGSAAPVAPSSPSTPATPSSPSTPSGPIVNGSPTVPASPPTSTPPTKQIPSTPTSSTATPFIMGSPAATGVPAIAPPTTTTTASTASVTPVAPSSASTGASQGSSQVASTGVASGANQVASTAAAGTAQSIPSPGTPEQGASVTTPIVVVSTNTNAQPPVVVPAPTTPVASVPSVPQTGASQSTPQASPVPQVGASEQSASSASAGCPYPSGLVYIYDLQLTIQPTGSSSVTNLPLQIPFSKDVAFYQTYTNEATGTVTFTVGQLSAGTSFRIRFNHGTFVYLTTGQQVSFQKSFGTNLIEFDVIQNVCAGDVIEEYSITIYQGSMPSGSSSDPMTSTGVAPSSGGNAETQPAPSVVGPPATFCEKYTEQIFGDANSTCYQEALIAAISTGTYENFIASGASLPFNVSSGYNASEIRHEVIEFLGAALGCNAAGFPQYTGPANLTSVFAGYNIDAKFFSQLQVSVNATLEHFGVSDADISYVITPFLNSFLKGSSQEICQAADCPSASSYQPMNAGASTVQPAVLKSTSSAASMSVSIAAIAVMAVAALIVA